MLSLLKKNFYGVKRENEAFQGVYFLEYTKKLKVKYHPS